MRYARIIAEVCSKPWAILDSTFDSIVQVLARCEAGERLSEDEIRAKVGEKKLQPVPFVIDAESGEMWNTVSLEHGILAHRPSDHAAQPQASSQQLAASSSSASAPKLTAVIPVFGILVNRVASLDISDTGTGVDALAQQFRQAIANPDVKNVVLLFDSPGGSVYGIDEFAQEIFDARGQGKKLVAQIDPLAASAAYYLASQADEIVITPSGEAGSIGVRAMHQDISKALETRGIKITNISAGKYKTEGNPYEPLAEDGLAFMQSRVNDYYDAFVKAVARGREVKKSEVQNGFGEGRVLGAAEAKRIGMVDRIATFDETLARLGAGAKSARVPMAAAAEVVQTPADPPRRTQVSVPAAVAAGFEVPNTATAETHTTEVVMESTNAPAAGAALSPTVTAINAQAAERVDQITRLATAHNMTAKLSAWLTSGVSLETVQAEILSSLRPQSITQPAAEDGRNARIAVVVDEADRKPKSLRVGTYLRAIAGAAYLSKKQSRYISPEAYAREMFRDPVTAGYLAAANPQDASSLAGGGFMIPDVLANEVVELLRPMAVVRSLGPATAPLVNGSLSLPKLTGGVTANYMGENKPITPSKVTGGQVKATAKKLAVLVPISSDLLRFASMSADEMVRNDAVRAVAQVEDISFIRSAGTANQPKGLKYWTPAANVVNSQATTTVTKTLQDLGTLWKLLAAAYVRFVKPGFIFSPRTYQYFFNLISANAVYIFRDEMLQKGTINGVPFRWTPQIPENLNVVGGRGSIESELYFADFADVVICDAPVVNVEMSTEAAYDDGSGTITSAFSNDQTVIRMIVEHDLIVRHQESISYLQGVDWS